MSVAGIVKDWPKNPTCGMCRRRQSYIYCSKCAVFMCALCSWTTGTWAQIGDKDRNVEESCRKCAGVAW